MNSSEEPDYILPSYLRNTTIDNLFRTFKGNKLPTIEIWAADLSYSLSEFQLNRKLEGFNTCIKQVWPITLCSEDTCTCKGLSSESIKIPRNLKIEYVTVYNRSTILYIIR